MKIPIVVVTSKDLSREEKKLLQGNVEMVMQKGSFGNKDLIQKVNEIIDNEKQTVSWVWAKTSSYLSLPLKKENQENLKKAKNIIKLNKIKSDYIHGFEVDLYELEVKLPDGTKEESTRWITKHGVTLKEVGFIDGSDGKLHFYSEFSNVKVFKQDERLFEVPNGYKVAPVEDLDDVNELLKTMVQRI